MVRIYTEEFLPPSYLYPKVWMPNLKFKSWNDSNSKASLALNVALLIIQTLTQNNFPSENLERISKQGSSMQESTVYIFGQQALSTCYLLYWTSLNRFVYNLSTATLDTFQDVLFPDHMKPCLHILVISISLLNHFVVRPTKTPKSADNKCQFLTFKVTFVCQKLSQSF